MFDVDVRLLKNKEYWYQTEPYIFILNGHNLSCLKTVKYERIRIAYVSEIIGLLNVFSSLLFQV